MTRQRQRDVRMDAAFVELVDDDGRGVGEPGIALEPCCEDALGDDQQRVRAV